MEMHSRNESHPLHGRQFSKEPQFVGDGVGVSAGSSFDGFSCTVVGIDLAVFDQHFDLIPPPAGCGRVGWCLAVRLPYQILEYVLGRRGGVQGTREKQRPELFFDFQTARTVPVGASTAKMSSSRRAAVKQRVPLAT